MPDFTFTEYPVYSPTWCAACAGHGGPFIDTQLEQMQIATAEGIKVFDGHVYLCATCVHQMTNLVGGASPEAMKALHTEIEELRYRVRLLEDELQAERDNKMVNREDFKEWLGDIVKRPPGRPRKDAQREPG